MKHTGPRMATRVHVLSPGQKVPSHPQRPDDGAPGHFRHPDVIRGETGVIRGETRARPTAAARAFLALLRVTGLVTGGGWRHLIRALPGFAVGSFGISGVISTGISMGSAYVGDGQPVVALAASGFFGLVYVLMWLNVVCSFMWSRCRYGSQFMMIRRASLQLSELSSSTEPATRLRRNVWWLFGTALSLMLLTIIVNAYYAIHAITSCPLPSKNCRLVIPFCISFSWFCITFCLIPLKYVFAALYVQSGYLETNAKLEAIVEGRYKPDAVAVYNMISVHGDLSRAFSRLTKIMSLELLLVMANGTIACVDMILIVISSLKLGTFVNMVQMTVLYLVMALVTMVLPSEATQRCLEEAGETRDLLLAAELRQPQLGPQLGLFRGALGRDLDTLGDLGLFRLRRSTILSISATILTNFVIMLQFYLTS